MTILERLHDHSNASLWTTFEYNGDGQWIYDGLKTSLVMVSYGLYNEKLAIIMCPKAYVVKCNQTRYFAK